MTKVSYKEPAGYAPMELLVRQSVSQMGPEQFAAYDAALRATDYYGLQPNDRVNFEYAIRAANERRQREEQPFNVTIRDGNRTGIPSLPFGLQWTPLVAIAGVLVIVALMGRR
jgi:hypothetical protein